MTLDRSELAQSPLVVAPMLLGCMLVTADCAGRIVEVEAYGGSDDPASHAFRGVTPRTEVMFGAIGRAYVCRSYGVHWCLNVVAHQPGEAGAILIRAIEPVAGLDAMRHRRGGVADRDLCRGPGRLAQALGITSEHNGTDLWDAASALRVDAKTRTQVAAVATTRVGLHPDRGATTPWRLSVAASPWVSRPRHR